MTMAYISNLLITMLLFIPAYLLVRWFFFWRRKTSYGGMLREMLLGLFVLFLAAFFTQILEPGQNFNLATMPTAFVRRLQTGADINLVPFKTICAFIDGSHFERTLINLGGNIVLFMPVGFFLPLLWQRWQQFGRIALLGLLCTCFIECIQLFIARHTDIDDILLNAVGVMMGYGIYALLRRWFPSLQQVAAPPKTSKEKPAVG